jgi:hypothetical protein
MAWIQLPSGEYLNSKRIVLLKYNYKREGILEFFALGESITTNLGGGGGSDSYLVYSVNLSERSAVFNEIIADIEEKIKELNASPVDPQTSNEVHALHGIIHDIKQRGLKYFEVMTIPDAIRKELKPFQYLKTIVDNHKTHLEEALEELRVYEKGSSKEPDRILNRIIEEIEKAKASGNGVMNLYSILGQFKEAETRSAS